MKTEPKYYHVNTGECSMTIIGGELLPGDAGHVWITTPAGQPLFQVRREHVRQSSPEDMAIRLRENEGGER